MNQTRKFALIGNQIAQSLSPQIHLLFAEQFNLTIKYELIEATVENLKFKTEQFFSNGGFGLNITRPFKQILFQHATSLSVAAQNAQAINILSVAENGSLHGDNTDGIGFMRSLHKHGINLSDKSILILGAGGAVHGILPELLIHRPQNIFIFNRSKNKAITLAESFNGVTAIDTAQIPQKTDMIINTISSDLPEQSMLAALKNLQATIFYDLNYGVRANKMRIFMQQIGVLNYFDGVGMLIEQAAEAFYLWHSLRPQTEDIYLKLPAMA